MRQRDVNRLSRWQDIVISALEAEGVHGSKGVSGNRMSVNFTLDGEPISIVFSTSGPGRYGVRGGILDGEAYAGADDAVRAVVDSHRSGEKVKQPGLFMYRRQSEDINEAIDRLIGDR